MITVHPLQTGRVRVRPGYLAGRSYAAQMIEGALSPRWSDWMPIFAWLIDHPQGLILVDTGESARIHAPGSVSKWSQRFTQYDVRPEDEIAAQLERLSVRPADVRVVVLTHLHSDHCDGLHAFGGSDICVDRAEYEMASGPEGERGGYLPRLWPDWLAPRLLDYEDSALGPFSRTTWLTDDGAVVAVPTPGHSVGHLSVVVRTKGIHLFLAGDLSLTWGTVMGGVPFGMASEQATHSLQSVRDLAAGHATIYLSSHDPQAPARLVDARLSHSPPAAMGKQ